MTPITVSPLPAGNFNRPGNHSPTERTTQLVESFPLFHHPTRLPPGNTLRFQLDPSGIPGLFRPPDPTGGGRNFPPAPLDQGKSLLDPVWLVSEDSQEANQNRLRFALIVFCPHCALQMNKMLERYYIFISKVYKNLTIGI